MSESPTQGLRVLVFTTLYPSAARPRHGIFVETRSRKLIESGAVEARVVAPVPWFPLRGRWFGTYASIARTPRTEDRFGIRVSHPRYLVIPKVGMSLQPQALAYSARREIERLIQTGFDFDVLDAHYFYPDGVAAAAVADALGKPFVITARGTDVNLIAQFPRQRREILAAAQKASALIAVSDALKQTMVSLGIPAERITVLRNGVDLEVFKPRGAEAARSRLGVRGAPLLASVGNLLAGKGHDLVVASLRHLPERTTLMIVGEGPERERLRSLVRALRLEQRVRFLPTMPQADLAWVYSAADALVLASSREGWPNVLLEAMACGTPVVATDVGGVREVVREAVAGEVVPAREPEAIARAIQAVVERSTPREAVRSYAARFGWEAVTEGQIAVFRAVSRV